MCSHIMYTSYFDRNMARYWQVIEISIIYDCVYCYLRNELYGQPHMHERGYNHRIPNSIPTNINWNWMDFTENNGCDFSENNNNNL